MLRLEKQMRVGLSTLLIALLAVTATQAQTAEEKASHEKRVVVTRGQATVRKPPDRAFLMLATEVRAKQPAEAQQKNAQMMTAVQQRLAKLVPSDAVRTLAYFLQEEFDHVNDRRLSRGYRASNTIEVRVDDIARTGEVIDAAVGSGVTTVSNVRFDLKDRDGAEREALKQAVADAWARAEAAAAGADLKLAGVARIEEEGPVRPMPMARMAMEMASAQADTPITAGVIEIEASVTLTAAIR
jgi:uncharacterized protein YggE